MSFLDLLKHRRSIRQYKEEAVSKEALEAIVEAGLLSPSGRNIRPWELIVVQKKETLEKMSECRVGSAKMLAGASVAIVVIADPEKTDVWTEDCSIVMSNMHNMAHDLGLGSCWIQGRLRQAPDGRTTEEYLRDILGYPKEYCLEAVLSIGVPAVHPEVWIGTNVSVLPGVTIGSNTIIGAGSVVNKDIPDGVIAAGNPCKVIRKITDADKKKYPVFEG